MVASATGRAGGDGGDLRLATEIRGAPARLWDGTAGEVVIAGSAGTGKTRAILEWVHRRCATERLRVLFLRKTLESLKASALVTYTEQVLYGFDGKRSAADGVDYFGGNRLRPAEFTYRQTGSKIVLGGLDSASKVFSTEYDAIFVNECTEITEDDWEKLTGRADRPRLGPQRAPSVVIGDCNPDAPTHWIKRRADAGRLALWPSFHRDNPAMWDRSAGRWLPAGERYMARLDALTGVRRARLRDGKWVAAEGQVFDAWREDVHVVDALPPSFRFAWHLGAVDWGWTNPGVLGAFAVDGDGRMALVAEHYHTRKPVDGWWIPRAQALTARYAVSAWHCDPSEPAYVAQFRAAGVPAVPAINAILPGVNAIQDRLAVQPDGLPRLFVLRSALIERDEALVEAKQPWSTVQEVPEYVWAKNAGGQTLKDKPVDANNHGLDMLRYGVAAKDLGPAPVEARSY